MFKSKKITLLFINFIWDLEKIKNVSTRMLVNDDVTQLAFTFQFLSFFFTSDLSRISAKFSFQTQVFLNPIQIPVILVGLTMGVKTMFRKDSVCVCVCSEAWNLKNGREKKNGKAPIFPNTQHSRLKMKKKKGFLIDAVGNCIRSRRVILGTNRDTALAPGNLAHADLYCRRKKTGSVGN